jgi:hypothetical protein
MVKYDNLLKCKQLKAGLKQERDKKSMGSACGKAVFKVKYKSCQLVK